jgi:hypothetical protein
MRKDAGAQETGHPRPRGGEVPHREPVTAPVRIALTTVPSITASGRPVVRSDRRMTALARGRPFRSGFWGTLGIHLRPATSNSPPM